MTKDEAKKQILGLFLGQLSEDDEALFGPDGIEGERHHKAFDGARKELIAEFERRTTIGAGPRRLIRALRDPL